MWVRSLGWKDPHEKEMAAHSNIIAWRISWTEEPGGLCPWGRKEWNTPEVALHALMCCKDCVRSYSIRGIRALLSPDSEGRRGWRASHEGR